MRTISLILALAACHRKEDEETSTPSTTETDTDTPGTTSDPEPVVSKADEKAILAAAEDDIAASSASGAQIAIWKDGAVVWQGAVGSAHPDRDQPIGPDTLFQIGSDTKKIAAIALLQQEAMGTLSRDQAVSDAIPGFALASDPAWSDGATLHDLISHQGGLYDYTPWDDAPADGELEARAFGDLAERGWAMAPAGAAWNYANPNFSLAGLATELGDGRAWADLVEQDVLAPLGMTRSYARAAEVDDDAAAGLGYAGSAYDDFDPFGGGDYVWGTVEPEDQADNAFTRPAGLIWSTATDQARLGGFLIDGDDAVLDADRLHDLVTAQVRMYPSTPEYSYGYGLFVYNGVNLYDGYHAVPFYMHGGNTLSMTSTFAVAPEQGFAISILSNGYGDDFTATLVAALERVADLPPPTTAPAMPMDETPHDQLVGTYVDPSFGELIVTDVDGALQLAFPALAALGYDVDSELNFAFQDVYTVNVDRVPYELTFVQDEDGTYRYLRDRLFVGTRGAAPTAARRAPSRVEVDLALSEMRKVNRLVMPVLP